jgi:hypothetical protein
MRGRKCALARMRPWNTEKKKIIKLGGIFSNLEKLVFQNV